MVLDLSPFLNLLPQLPFMPIAALSLSLIAIFFWDSLAKPFGLEQHRWICAVVAFVSAVLALAQGMHLTWEWIKPHWKNSQSRKKRDRRLQRLTYGEKELLGRFMKAGALYFDKPKAEIWLQTLLLDGLVCGPFSHGEHESYQMDPELREFIQRNPRFIELPRT